MKSLNYLTNKVYLKHEIQQKLDNIKKLRADILKLKNELRLLNKAHLTHKQQISLKEGRRLLSNKLKKNKESSNINIE